MKDKDPAFLFYSKDFYEGTRTMLPNERACYIDLMIYQHQHGYIPKELDRVLMYCSGIDQATLEATLEAKFEQTENGWTSSKLKKVMEDRKEFSKKQSINGTVGQFFKRAKATLTATKYNKLRNLLKSNYDNNQILELIKKEGSPQAMLEAMLKQYANEDVIVNKDLINNTIILKEKQFDEFWNMYDKKVGPRNDIMKKFASLSEEDRTLIMDHVPKYVESTPDKKYRKNPMTYLNQEGWTNEILNTNETKGGHPDRWDRDHAKTLSPQQTTEYYAHLRSKGLEYRNGIWMEKK